MEYSIQADHEFLRVRVAGRDTDDAPSHFCAEVLRESERLGRRRILIELAQKFPLSPSSQYELVTRLPQLGMTPWHSIALVHREPAAKEANGFINVVAENRDISVRNFWDVEEAADWLRSRAA